MVTALFMKLQMIFSARYCVIPVTTIYLFTKQQFFDQNLPCQIDFVLEEKSPGRNLVQYESNK